METALKTPRVHVLDSIVDPHGTIFFARGFYFLRNLMDNTMIPERSRQVMLENGPDRVVMVSTSMESNRTGQSPYSVV